MQPLPECELRGTLRLADVTRFHYFHTLRRTWPIGAIAALLLILLVPSLVFAAIANPGSGWGTVLTNAIPFFGLLLLWLLLLGVMPYFTARKQFAAQSYLREPVVYAFTPETISATGSSMRWSIAWNVVKRVRETKSLFLIYHAANVAVIVPKSFFTSPSEMETWRQIVATHLGSKLIDKPGLVGRSC